MNHSEGRTCSRSPHNYTSHKQCFR